MYPLDVQKEEDLDLIEPIALTRLQSDIDE